MKSEKEPLLTKGGSGKASEGRVDIQVTAGQVSSSIPVANATTSDKADLSALGVMSGIVHLSLHGSSRGPTTVLGPVSRNSHWLTLTLSWVSLPKARLPF